MKIKNRIIIIALPILAFLGLAVWYLHGQNIAVLEPAGQIAQSEKDLFVFAMILSAVVVIPVYVMTILIIWKYRESNTKAKYRPDWDHSRLFETIWWGIPMIIITILSVVTWNSSHSLDPFRAIDTKIKPLTVQVVSLDWKWLFIYPQQRIASVNYLAIPNNIPVHFYLTSDTVMNSFWVPNLGGQIYAMPGMSTQLNLIANRLGSYPGSSANISGKGFATMTFTVQSMTSTNFSAWVIRSENSPNKLSLAAYNNLAKPSEANRPKQYSSVVANLYQTIIDKYMMPSQPSNKVSMEMKIT